MTRINRISDLETLREEVLHYRKSFESTIILCGGTGCQASRSKDLIQAVKDELVTQKMEKSVLVRSTGCHGFCEQGPIVII
ncbi:MAG: (2Fe-2S) ferredoxin domain-containing protein, partial [Deltaproteobacteria bacterium]|nr:(2Fe-2S) ferredoxin domain-containing protein [Deltaproteobacteria bacterium]